MAYPRPAAGNVFLHILYPASQSHPFGSRVAGRVPFAAQALIPKQRMGLCSTRYAIVPPLRDDGGFPLPYQERCCDNASLQPRIIGVVPVINLIMMQDPPCSLWASCNNIPNNRPNEHTTLHFIGFSVFLDSWQPQ